jgi:hypothetical protein
MVAAAARSSSCTRAGRSRRECESVKKRFGLSDAGVRAAAVEFLFGRTGPAVVKEAERQLR